MINNKVLLLTCMLLCNGGAYASPAADQPLQGEVLESMDAAGYTYLRLRSGKTEQWAAIPKASLKPGTQITIEHPMVMSNFVSKTLNRSFPSIVFGNLSGGNASAPLNNEPSSIADEKLAKATGKNAYTVAEINTRSAALKDQQVLVRGKVVKYTPDVMGSNWLHIRDGSGNATDKSNDLVVTSKAPSKLGEIVTLQGVVHTEKALGGGYHFKVLIEDAAIQK